VNIRCICGNETTIIAGGKPGYILRDESWFDKAKSEIRCLLAVQSMVLLVALVGGAIDCLLTLALVGVDNYIWSISL